MKYLKYLFFSIVVCLCSFSVLAKDYVVKEVIVREISGSFSISAPQVDGDTITPIIGFKENGDYVSYQILVNFDTHLYKIVSVNDNNKNSNLNTEYFYKDNKVFMTMKYKKNNTYTFNPYDIDITLEGKKNVNPPTKDIFVLFLVLLYFVIFSYCFVSKKNKKILLFLLFLFPVMVYAKETVHLKIKIDTSKMIFGYRVNFDGNGATSGNVSSITCLPDEVCSLPRNQYSDEFLVFEGWALNPDGAVAFSDEQRAYDINENGENEVTLYAAWKLLKYIVHFNGNGSSSGSMEDILCITDTSCSIPSNGYSRNDGYVFKGWSTSPEGNVSYSSNASYTNISSTREITLYAIWGPPIWDFSYTGGYQTFTIPNSGRYKLEVWGAQGGTYSTSGGTAGYSYGTINLNAGTLLYVYVGGMGGTNSSGFNGGGSGSANSAGGGGGTDIRIGQSSLYARVIVAGGGGGHGQDSCAAGGVGGGTSGSGGANQGSCGTQAYGASQTSGGSGGVYSGVYGSAGLFGQGAAAANGSYDGGGGGGGWYGGGSGASGGWSNGGGGGSGYVYTSSTVSYYPSGCLLNSSYYLTDAQTISGSYSFLSPTGVSETGHTGNGYARISYLGA